MNYARVTQLWLRRLDSDTEQPLVGTDGAEINAFWSPDSASIGFFSTGQLKRLDLTTGLIRTLARSFNAVGGSWGADGTILFVPSPSSPVMRVRQNGTGLAEATRLDPPMQIVLTIDPTATPREVAVAYASLRKRQFGRIRRLQPKQAELAVFASRQRSQTDRQQMEEWNRMHPRNRYRFPSVFKRDAHLAIQALADCARIALTVRLLSVIALRSGEAIRSRNLGDRTAIPGANASSRFLSRGVAGSSPADYRPCMPEVA
jgi:hypothetical protein